jgi:hypothetical protein
MKSNDLLKKMKSNEDELYNKIIELDTIYNCVVDKFLIQGLTWLTSSKSRQAKVIVLDQICKFVVDIIWSGLEFQMLLLISQILKFKI